MKKIFYVLSILLYFYLPKISSAATVLSQDQASGYFQVSGDGATYFISTDETRVERLGQYTIQFKTQLDNFKFATPTGTPVASVTVSIRRHGPEYFSPGRLYYFCRMGEEFNLVYSSTVVTSEDWDGLLNQGRFVDYTFNFPASPCDLSRVTTFSLGFERAFPDVEGTDKGSSPGVGMGVAGDQHIIFLDNYEWKIRIDSQIKPGKTPVLIVPGVTGTDLTQGEQKLWLDLERNFTDINDQFMDPLAFNQNLTPSVDGVQVGSVIAKAALNLGAKITVFDYVAGLVREFEDQGYVTGKDLFLFPYDWRYGVREKNTAGKSNVDILKEKIIEILSQTGADKIDIVAHSTGGLLVKKYVQENPLSHNLGKAVFVGVPNTGSPKAAKVLVNGDNFGIPWLEDEEMKKISTNLPVVYDLLPSQKYYNNAGSFVRVIDQGFIKSEVRDLDYQETKTFLINDHGLNAQAQASAEELHSLSFDNFDLRSAGVDLYSINGCKTPTLSKIIERRAKPLIGPEVVSYDSPVQSPGDGTVTLESATNLPISSENKYYALNAEHAKMLSQEGVKQQISNILTGSNREAKGITQDISECKLKGKAYSIFSPVNIRVIDSLGNQASLESGSVINEIPGSDFQVWGDHKFVFLPTDGKQSYSIALTGTGSGSFTFKDQDIDGDTIIKTQVFPNLSVTQAFSASVEKGPSGETVLIAKTAATSVPTTIYPASVIGQEQSGDVLPPVSTSTLSGTMGESGYYRSDVSIVLSSDDLPSIGGESQTSGVLELRYILDGALHQVSGTSTVFTVNQEGSHNLKFFAVDKAGNNELESELNFIIDKTPPELEAKFDPEKFDLVFTVKDAWPTKITQEAKNSLANDKVKISDQDFIITATDMAGNTTVLTLRDKDRKNILKAEVKSLSYNGALSDISKTSFGFYWAKDAKNNLVSLTQNIKSKTNFYILAAYLLGNTWVTGVDQAGKINQNYKGLKLIKVYTDKGDFKWSW